MKKTLLLCTALLALTAPAAFAGLDLTWDACNQGPLHQSAKTFDCAGGAPALLYGCFQSPVALPTFFGMDISIDIQINDSAATPAFWHFEPLACNDGFLTLSDNKPAVPCPTATHTNLWGPGGGTSDAFITAYAPAFTGANRPRLNMTITRPSSSTIAVNASPANNFGFELTFLLDNAGTCAGCNSSATIVWNSATLFSAAANSVRPEPSSTVITSRDASLVSPCVGAGPSGGGQTNCEATPAHNRTWGSLKALYR